MYFPPVESDQLYTWSDKNGKPAYRHLEKTPSSPPTPTAAAQGDPAWLADRALQALWQAGVQMRRRPRPWPQILPFGEPPGLAATNGLCAAGVSRSDYRVHCQLPPGARDLRSDLRDQPRTAAPPGGPLTATMSEALSALPASIDAGLGGVLLANMVEAWLAGNPDCLESVEVADEAQEDR